MTRAERKKAELRREIIDASFECFAQRGYHATGIADIATTLGIGHGPSTGTSRTSATSSITSSTTSSQRSSAHWPPRMLPTPPAHWTSTAPRWDGSPRRSPASSSTTPASRGFCCSRRRASTPI
ncbi:helix-turn-helix domain-containing protein [Rhodococcus sp. NJ-530]|uniref:TetR/AcrR family transcriptional regulator n=1 Tax=Rhodococcus sp. NJ-530 TaxID=2490853 RepID=UPI001F153BC3|nr:helix-turn-helix domain-containing protein [Rhodococcus sp. NJ-530]